VGAVWAFQLLREASITSVSDVLTDQGGKVRVSWHKSEFDYPRDLNQVTHYALWRRIPVSGTELLPPPGSAAGLLADSLGVLYDLVATVPALQAPSYNVVAPTMFDSSGTGPHPTRFIVTAHTANPNVYYISSEDSGYSVDNLPPGAVAGGTIASLPDGAMALAWKANRSDPDLKGYRVHRSTTSGFTPGPSTLLGFTADTSFADTAAQHGVASYYRIMAIDLHDNPGPPSAELSGTPVGVKDEPEIPTTYSLAQNYPNPFNPSTTIRFGLPQQTTVRIVVYTQLGQLVAVLVQEEREPGYHEIHFDATGLSSGVYFYRMTAGEFVQTRKFLLVR
jgi:hypothetical protein